MKDAQKEQPVRRTLFRAARQTDCGSGCEGSAAGRDAHIPGDARRQAAGALAVLLAAMLTGCGASSPAAHTQDKGSAVDQVLSARAAEADGERPDASDEATGAEKTDLILTPESYREQTDPGEEGVDADLLALARQIAAETGVEDAALTDGAAGGGTEVADWQQLDLTDTGDGFAMAEMPEDCDVDVDLTILNSTMVYSEVYNMMYYPEKYIGKSVRMRGTYTFYQDEETEKIYLACFISDAAACCQQGIEFEPADMTSMKYPDDYPEEFDEITVVGVYDTYEEDGLTYCTLRDAVLEEA